MYNNNEKLDVRLRKVMKAFYEILINEIFIVHERTTLLQFDGTFKNFRMRFTVVY